jgi:hypothetical protein
LCWLPETYRFFRNKGSDLVIIGLYGESRAGKDSVAKILVNQHRYEWRSFAGNLRQILLQINPWLINNDSQVRYADAVRNYGLDYVKKNYPESVEYMISLGQSVRDIIGEDSWVDTILPKQGELRYKDLVISDVRQPNEYDRIKDYDGQVWKIVRRGTVARGMDNLLEYREFDATLYNNGTHIDLINMVDECIASLG